MNVCWDAPLPPPRKNTFDLDKKFTLHSSRLRIITPVWFQRASFPHSLSAQPCEHSAGWPQCCP